MHEFAASGILAAISEINIVNEISDINKYLIAKCDANKIVNPYVFEDVVGSVFRNLGYRSDVTKRSYDGGIDVLLEDSNGSKIGVQVKRTKNKIAISQMREFLGAMVENDITKGIYVTTSTFTTHSENLVAKLKPDYEIQLIDGTEFYEALKVAQIKSYETEIEKPFKRPLMHRMYSEYPNGDYE